jgi:hypothetical protein
MQADEMKTPSDLRSMSKDKQIVFIRNEIVRLECKQLAESIVAIKEKPGPERASAEQKRKKRECQEYELMFDEAINVLPMTLDLDNVKLLARYQQGILITSPYDASIASSMQFNTSAAPPQSSLLPESKAARGRKKQQSGAPDEVKPIKQIANIFDKDIVGREVDFRLYGFCHHCKEIKPRNTMVQCKYRAAKIETQSHKGIGQNGTYKGTSPIYAVGNKHGQRSLLSHGKYKKVSKDNEYMCERLFCYVCISLTYDQNPATILANTSWICPFCQVRGSLTM